MTEFTEDHKNKAKRLLEKIEHDSRMALWCLNDERWGLTQNKKDIELYAPDLLVWANQLNELLKKLNAE